MDTIPDVETTIPEPQKLTENPNEEIKIKEYNNTEKDNIIPKEDKPTDDDGEANSKEDDSKDIVATNGPQVGHEDDEHATIKKTINEICINDEDGEFGIQDCHEKNEKVVDTNNPIIETCTDEEVGEFEDVIVPEEEEVDEIIVPDEAEAEDLTDDKEEERDNNFVKADEEETTKDSSEADENDMNTLLPEEEESTKSSSIEISDIDEKSDKESTIHEEQQEESSKDFENDDNDHSSAEPEVVPLEDDSMKETLTCPLNDNTNSEHHLDEGSSKTSIDDPLDCIENEAEDDLECNNNNKNSNTSYENDDEDDEVQFVETRNSPICIESDEDDRIDNFNRIEDVNNQKQNVNLAKALVTVTKNTTVTRTSARKSTSKQQQQQNTTNVKKIHTTVPQLQSKTKNFSYLQNATKSKRFTSITSTQHIVDCIDLLDSSDEESTSSRKISLQPKQVKTPQKRTLLAAKGNYYKSCSKNTVNNSSSAPNNIAYNVRQQVKKPAPPPLPPPTPQSNFLNAVQLQPAAISGSNPPAFSALLSNKNVIIPNAFYGNPPSVRSTPDTDIERRFARWVENFLNQFCKPQFVPTHSCYVFLQKALKYKDFIRIKTLRSNLNKFDTRDQLNNQLMTELRTMLLKNIKKTTNYGRRFCELTCLSVQGKALSLMTHSVTGKITLKTCNMETSKTPATISSATSSSNASSNSLNRKRQLDEDEDEYTPDKAKPKSKAKPPSENGDRDSEETSEDRKRSLRTKRTKRLDNSFSYNEDDLLAEYEIDDEEEAEKLAQAEVQRKIEQKRLEAQRQRQQQVKSFENAFIQAFAKSTDRPTSSMAAKNLTNQRLRIKSSTVATSSSIGQYTANNDAEDLLQATWIENLENEDTQIISDDDEPKEHRIYKQQQRQLLIQSQQQHYQTSNKSMNKSSNTSPSARFNKLQRRHYDETITADDQYHNENENYLTPVNWPKNIDPHMHVNGKEKDKCVICHLSCQRLVHHYVNEHRGCEVYNSRISSTQTKLLRQGNYTASNVSLYKNGQFQYEAYCVFCEKQSRFMLPYWYQHFTMHTGEYAYRCTGCGVRKPTRSLLTQHIAQGCPEDGSVAQDYMYDSKSMQIDARICTLCNYVQLHRNNIVKHLHQQHNIKQILPKHIQTIVLLKTSAPTSISIGSASPTSSSNSIPTNPNYYSRSISYDTNNTYIIDDDDTEMASEVILNDAATEETPYYNTENHYYNYIPPYMQAAVNSGNFSFENVDASDDLSFMICGMLDVQINPE